MNFLKRKPKTPPPPPVDPHEECRKKRRVIVKFSAKKHCKYVSAYALEEFEDYTLVCYEETPHHQWVIPEQVKELKSLKKNSEVEELEQMYKLGTGE